MAIEAKSCSPGEAAKSLYDRDFQDWCLKTADLLRARRFGEVDIEHIAEEIEDLGKRDQREVYSRLVILMMHLLKWQYQAPRSNSWRQTVREQRRALKKIFEQSPSLFRIPVENWEDIYVEASQQAVDETGLDLGTFPSAAPWSPTEALNYRFLPE